MIRFECGATKIHHSWEGWYYMRCGGGEIHLTKETKCEKVAQKPIETDKFGRKHIKRCRIVEWCKIKLVMERYIFSGS